MHATASGTEKYFKSRNIHPDKKHLFRSLHVSALGMGTYLGKANEETDRLYEQSLFKAGLDGINFFESAINYRSMRSEKVLGRVIQQLAREGIERDQIVIATKGGYIPHEGDLEEADYTRIHYFDSGLIRPDQVVGGCHCLIPAFLENQIGKSLQNLGLECIDLYYLHNPEIQLLEVGEMEFYQRLTAAFSLLEEEVHKKRIASYGLATWNGLRQKPSSKGTLQLQQVLACAKEAGGEDHHFSAVQLPYNLVMLEAIKLKNQLVGEEKKTVTQVLFDNNLSWMVSSPLMQSHIAALPARIYEELPSAKSLFVQALQFILASHPLCTAFAGMKQIDHLVENQSVLTLENWNESQWHQAATTLGVTLD